ncbi:multiheme c-type cytochrome [Chitinophaga arvensicola]|uniref:Cytochrome c554 and c-prime n=1 Tax=Chitinophaga arvensicola TaxID=29529 RepID=A0A1I0S6F2_9BACT|nr:multiheme c-type cytochrome [Chitinophaga arvensicola]SEW51043.1 Cytochrome c554 and c-prime [Chitinophaga arvensicola]
MSKRLLFVSGSLLTCIILLSQCISRPSRKEDLRGQAFAGAATCMGCHKNVYDAWLASAHHHTSSPASATTVKGSFLSPDNIFRYANGEVLKMETLDSALYQSAYRNDTLRERHRFDIAIGSGTKAQTYLYWEADKYFQLPLSYLVPAASWANSPGFPADHPRFNRVIPSTCFGCHSSAVGIKDSKIEGVQLTETFEKNELVYGIDCERCHGAAAAHVEFQTAHPEEKQPKYITTFSSLNNQQRLDMCGLCHSGLKAPQKPAFTYKPGDPLSDYFFPATGKPAKPTEMDVHGTQYQLFTASQCAIRSTDMNCSSCHQPHTKETNDVATFSQRCMNCHTTEKHNFCSNKDMPAALLAANCIDCHMPALPSRGITLLTDGQSKPVPDFIRTHLISIYPEETKKVLAKWQEREKK